MSAGACARRGPLSSGAFARALVGGAPAGAEAPSAARPRALVGGAPAGAEAPSAARPRALVGGHPAGAEAPSAARPRALVGGHPGGHPEAAGGALAGAVIASSCAIVPSGASRAAPTQRVLVATHRARYC
jgi:hypothetical protein